MEDYAYGQWDEAEYDEEWADEYEEPYDEDAFNAQDYDDTEFPDEIYGEEASLEEAYASYLDARRHFSQLKAARGYYPIVALTDGGAQSMPAFSQAPRAPMRKGMGKGKPGKGKIKGTPSYRQSHPPQRGSPTSRANATK